MPSLFDLLEPHYPSAAQCAAALGISRQAYCQARARKRLSESAAIRAAGILSIPAGDALFLNAAPTDPAPPVLNPAPDLPRQPDVDATQSPALYYVKSGKEQIHRHPDQCGMKNIHVISSQSQNDAIDLIRWVFAVTQIPADSPRFAHYVSRWRVPEKIDAAKKAGTFAEITRNCPPIDPAWIRFVPAALEAYEDFVKPRKPIDKQPPFSPPQPTAPKQLRRAA